MFGAYGLIGSLINLNHTPGWSACLNSLFVFLQVFLNDFFFLLGFVLRFLFYACCMLCFDLAIDIRKFQRLFRISIEVFMNNIFFQLKILVCAG